LEVNDCGGGDSLVEAGQRVLLTSAVVLLEVCAGGARVLMSQALDQLHLQAHLLGSVCQFQFVADVHFTFSLSWHAPLQAADAATYVSTRVVHLHSQPACVQTRFWSAVKFVWFCFGFSESIFVRFLDGFSISVVQLEPLSFHVEIA
jgi:hypothetical protein